MAARSLIVQIGPANSATASVAATVRHMLPQKLHESSWAEETRTLDPGPAHVCLYVGFKGDIREAGASGANKWFWNTWSTEDGEIRLLDAWRNASGARL